MINTHKVMGENIIKYANTKSVYLINDKRFVWGNVKPDCTPKYKFKKHYFNESIDMIVEKIKYLSSLTLEEVYYDMTIGKFSEELGVVCHFLCDFFCAPHYYRWEFKSTSAVKHHMMYEKKLAKLAKEFELTGIINTDVEPSNIKAFILQLQKQYDGSLDYHNDLTFSYYVCDSVLNMVLDSVFLNDSKVSEAI
jgi:hypothetical protein